MLPDRVANPGPLTYESGALPIVLRGPALAIEILKKNYISNSIHMLFHFLVTDVIESILQMHGIHTSMLSAIYTK